MKYTNIKKLLIKFMGGGLINFPTRFLRWVKIDGDTACDDGGEGGSSDNNLVDSAVSFYNENKNTDGFFMDITDLEGYNENYRETTTEEQGNGNNVVVFLTNDNKQIAFKLTDNELDEFIHKIATFNDWRNSYISFPITKIITFNYDGTPYIMNYEPSSLGQFGGAILGHYDYVSLGLTGKEDFNKLNSISDIITTYSDMFFYNSDWIYRRTIDLNMNNYNFKQQFDQVFNIYKLKVGTIGTIEYGLIKIVDKNNEDDILFTTYNIYLEH